METTRTIGLTTLDISYVIPTLGKLLRLATPVIVGQLGIMLMALVDTVMVGRLGSVEIAAAGIGSTFFTAVLLFCLGTLAGLETLCAHSYGEGNLAECQRWLIQAFLLAFVLFAFGWGMLLGISDCLSSLGVHPTLIKPTQSYMALLNGSLLPTLIFVCVRQYLATLNIVLVTTLVVGLANLLNAFLNWILIFGNLGFSPLGLAGAGLATTLTRAAMAISLLVYAYSTTVSKPHPRRALLPDRSRLLALLRLGLPAGAQYLLRGAVFPIAGTLIARLGAIPTAAHTLALNLGSFAYMIPVGLSSASCILVGQNLGAKKLAAARTAGWLALFLGTSLMFGIALSLFFLRNVVIQQFTQDKEVIALGAHLLIIVACFAIPDAIQTVATGSLRGYKNTTTALYTNLVSFWIVAIPLGSWLCFYRDYGVVGLWFGLLVGIFCATFFMLRKWLQMKSLSLSAR